MYQYAIQEEQPELIFPEFKKFIEDNKFEQLNGFPYSKLANDFFNIPPYILLFFPRIKKCNYLIDLLLNCWITLILKNFSNSNFHDIQIFIFINCGKNKRKNKNKNVGESSNINSLINQQLKEHKLMLDQWNGYEILNNSYKEEPKSIEDYDNMVNEAMNYFMHPLGKATIDDFINKIKTALNGRKLRYIRMIGAGSMYGHLNHYNYDDSDIAKNERILIKNLDNNYKQKYLKLYQIVAIFQFTLELLIIQHFNKLKNSEEEIKGPPEMTFKIIDSYINENLFNNIILIESTLGYNLEIMINYRQKFLHSINAFQINNFTNLFYLPKQTNIYFNKWIKEEEEDNEKEN
ncbi:hypothetical protein Mgra_00001562 [Meloidogyne graminicola]|uniref:Uncharacterized protein n=1 Tax=Meloidogyne graminicola TaxID=189291 RepID=A0A8T0A0V1_9BILA|nr:hypothetical protein Mgra_00001562 [Meloidogyne graminicola]